jgi:hypothetical protein
MRKKIGIRVQKTEEKDGFGTQRRASKGRLIYRGRRCGPNPWPPV